MPTLSVAIITKNEADDIAACLASVTGWTHEIVVVDSGSIDGTQEICRRHGAKVIDTADWPGFGPQKNRALDACSGDWIVEVDADERLPPELAQGAEPEQGEPELFLRNGLMGGVMRTLPSPARASSAGAAGMFVRSNSSKKR